MSGDKDSAWQDGGQPDERRQSGGGLASLRSLITHATEAVAAAFMFLIMVMFIIQVGARYLFNSPLPWTEETALLLFPWLVFWGCCFLVPLRGHVSFDIFYALARPGLRRIYLIVGCLLIVVCFLWILPPTWDFVDFMWRRRTPLMGVRYFWVYLCFILFLVVLALRAAWLIAVLLRKKGWQDHV